MVVVDPAVVYEAGPTSYGLYRELTGHDFLSQSHSHGWPLSAGWEYTPRSVIVSEEKDRQQAGRM
jgi:hypothetical protein